MTTAFFIMAILGCGDAEASCRQVRIADAHYATMDSCVAATSAVLTRNTDLQYPVVSAQCRGVTAGTAEVERARYPRG